MAQASHPTLKESISKLNHLITDVEVAMLTSLNPEGEMHTRPMVTQPMDEHGDLWFVSAEENAKIDEMKEHPQVHLSYALKEKNKYVSISGHATLMKDSKKARELWKPSYQAWFSQGPNDPNIVLIKIEVDTAEYWDGPKLGFAKLTDLAKAIVLGRDAAAEKINHGEIHLKN
jgi:general stress protein 26